MISYTFLAFSAVIMIIFSTVEAGVAYAPVMVKSADRESTENGNFPSVPEVPLNPSANLHSREKKWSLRRLPKPAGYYEDSNGQYVYGNPPSQAYPQYLLYRNPYSADNYQYFYY